MDRIVAGIDLGPRQANKIAKFIRHKLMTGREEILKGEEVFLETVPIEFEYEPKLEETAHWTFKIGHKRFGVDYNPLIRKFEVCEDLGPGGSMSYPFLSISETALERI